jgi:transcriptional regulator with XRE-family HTH domain
MNTSFKLALSNLLDDTETFSRKEWANYLLVSEPAISQWTKGKTLPRAEHLKSILLYLENFERETVQDCLYMFHQMADLPISQTLDADLQVRYRRFHSITEYISTVYKDGLETELLDLQGVFRKELYYLFSSITRVTKEVAEDFAEFNNSLVLTKALRSITHKELQEWFKTKLVKQVEPISEGSLQVKEIHGQYNKNRRDSYFKPVEHRDFAGASFYEIFNPLQRSIICAPMKYTRQMLHQVSIEFKNIELQPHYFDFDAILSANKERHYLEKMSIGDGEAFKGIYDLYYQDVFRYLSNKSIIQADIEEIVTNVFATLWKDRLRLDYWGDFRTHLYRLSDTCLRCFSFAGQSTCIVKK